MSVVVPTFDEEGNVRALIARLDAVLRGLDAEVLFVDDSTDGTVAAIEEAREAADTPVSVLHRPEAVGGLGGAVLEGIRRSRGDWVVVMDGDLQHPPELVPALLPETSRVDAVVASRYAPGGSSGGLGSPLRTLASRGATALARLLFPGRLGTCTDPMTGFFSVRRDAIDVAALRPLGFKILLEILARNDLRVAEVPFAFAERRSGSSKASAREGGRFLLQLLRLRLVRGGSRYSPEGGGDGRSRTRSTLFEEG